MRQGIGKEKRDKTTPKKKLLMSSDRPRGNQRSMRELPASLGVLQRGTGQNHFV